MIINLNPLTWFAKAAVTAPAKPVLTSSNPQENTPAQPAVEMKMNKVETFFEKIGSWLKLHFKNLPSEEVQVSSAVNYVAPFVEELDSMVDPALAPVINPILDKIKTGLAALATTISQAQTPAGAANVSSILGSLTSNATALESAFQVKDAATQTKVTGIITLISGEFNAIAARYSTAAAAASAA